MYLPGARPEVLNVTFSPEPVTLPPDADHEYMSGSLSASYPVAVIVAASPTRISSADVSSETTGNRLFPGGRTGFVNEIEKVNPRRSLVPGKPKSNLVFVR